MRNVLAEVDAARLLEVAPKYEAIGCDFKLVTQTYCETYVRGKCRTLETVRVRDFDFPAELLLKTCMILDAVKIDGQLSRFTDMLVRHGIARVALVHRIDFGKTRDVYVSREAEGDNWRRLRPPSEDSAQTEGAA